MNRWKRNLVLGIVFLFMLSVCGCQDKKTSESPKQPTVTPAITSEDKDSSLVKEKDIVTPSVTEAQEKEDFGEMKEISIYTLDSDTAEKVPVTALVPKDTVLTPELIVDKVTESMTDAACMVGVDSITTDGDKVIISFKDDQPPVINVGSSVEAGILDSFAQSILDNIPEYHKIIFRIMDQPYATGHFEFGLNEVYMEMNSN